MIEECRDYYGTEVKWLLPGRVMEGFQEEVAFTRLWPEKREGEIPEGRSGLHKGTEEGRACGQQNDK